MMITVSGNAVQNQYLKGHRRLFIKGRMEEKERKKMPDKP
jgi:hypothetical protein